MANNNGNFGVYVDVRPKLNKTTFQQDINAQVKSYKAPITIPILPKIDKQQFENNIQEAINKMRVFQVPVEIKVGGYNTGSGSKGGGSGNSASSQAQKLQVAEQQMRQSIASAQKFLNDAGKNASQFSVIGTNVDGARESIKFYNKTLEETITLSRAVGETDWSMTLQSNAQRANAQIAAMDKSVSTLTNKIKLYMQQNTALSKKAPQVYSELNTLQENLSNLDLTDPNAKVMLTQYGSRFQELQSQAKELGAEVDSLGHKFKETFTTRIRSMFSVMLFSAAMSTMMALKQNVIDIDSAMTQLKIVTGESDNSLAKYFDDAAEAAKRYGNSVTDIISSTETYARLGYSLSESLNLANITNQFANVAAIDEGDATTSLTSILKAYNKDASEAERITDMLVKVGQDFAISASEIGVALENSGSALHVANTSLEESIALAAAGNASIQDASKVGNALKTLSAYIRGSKTDLKDLGEEAEGAILSTSKLEEKVSALTGGKVHLLEDDGQTYRSVYDVMLDIASVWDKMSDVNRASLLESIAGKRQATVVASIITNIKDLEGAFQEAQDSEGTLANATEIYLDSIQGKTDQFKAEFQKFSADFLNSDLIKGVVSFGTTLLSVLDSTAGKIVAIGGLIASTPLFLPLVQDINKVGVALKALENIKFTMNSLGEIENIWEFSQALEGLSASQAKLVVSQSALTEAGKKQLLTYYLLQSQAIQLEQVEAVKTLTFKDEAVAQQLANKIGAEAIAIEGEQYILKGQITVATLLEAKANGILTTEETAYVDALIAEIEANNARLGQMGALKGAYAGLGTSLKAFFSSPLGIAVAVAVAIAAIAKAIDYVLDKTNQSTEELIESFDKTTQDLQSIKNEISDIDNQLNELKNKQLSIVDENDKQNLQNQIDLLKQRKELLEQEQTIRQNREKVKLID